MGLFLANHGSRTLPSATTHLTRVVVGDDVALYQRILPSLRQVYRTDLEEHAQVTWPALLEAISERPARDTLFACHGRFDATMVAASELDLGSAGSDHTVSFARVFEHLDLQGCRSVLMGSCVSGVSRTEIGAEYLGLPAAMLASGVRYVVGALWNIPALSTAVVIERLMLSLRDASASVAVVLSDVQRGLAAIEQEQVLAWVAEKFSDDPQLQKLLSNIRARGPYPFADPYHWAGLQATGDI